MSKILNTEVALPGEDRILEGRLADIISGDDTMATVTIDNYELSAHDRIVLVAALRTVALAKKELHMR